MINLFTALELKHFSFAEILNWNRQLDYFLPSSAPIYSCLKQYLSDVTIPSDTFCFSKLSHILINDFSQQDYMNPELYAHKQLLHFEEVLSQDWQTTFSISLSPVNINYFREGIERHPAAQFRDAILQIFSPSTEYFQEVSDLLILAYSYAKTLSSSLKNSDNVIQDYHQKMYFGDNSSKTISLRTYHDTLYRLKKKNNSQTPLASFIEDGHFLSYLDVEITSNLLRYTDSSKNPFLSALNHPHSKYKKRFSFKKFLSSFQAISLNQEYIQLKHISAERLYNHNQYVLERITNGNFILGIYNLKHYIQHIQQNMQQIYMPINAIHSALLSELMNWIDFPLLSTRLRLLAVIYHSLPQILSLPEQYERLLAELLKTIRLYHLHVLLPLWVKSFLYVSTIFELLSMPSSKRSIVDTTEYSSFFKKLQKQISTFSNSSCIQNFQPSAIDKNLKNYFSSVKTRLTYFDSTENSLRPIMVLKVLNLNPHLEIPNTPELTKYIESRSVHSLSSIS